jgi:hypothetical protein
MKIGKTGTTGISAEISGQTYDFEGVPARSEKHKRYNSVRRRNGSNESPCIPRSEDKRCEAERRARMMEFERRYGLRRSRGSDSPHKLTACRMVQRLGHRDPAGRRDLWLRDGKPILFQWQSYRFTTDDARRIQRFCAACDLQHRFSCRRIWCWYSPGEVQTVFLWRAREPFPLKRAGKAAPGKPQKPRSGDAASTKTAKRTALTVRSPLNLTARHRAALRFYAHNTVKAGTAARMFCMSPEWFSKVLHSPGGSAFFSREIGRVAVRMLHEALGICP